MRHLNINHQKISRIFQLFAKIGCAAAVLTFVACNLFIEDELDWREDIPVHTGYGYDEPVTENGEFYDLTYQLNSNVNILSDNALNYLRNVNMDNMNWIGVLDYDLNTPKELRPVRGEILFHDICDKIPEGMIHQVICATEMEGYYKVLVCVVPFEDLFKEIDMDVDLGKGLNLKGFGNPEEPEEAEESEEDTSSLEEADNHQNTHSANSPRRADAVAEQWETTNINVKLPINFFKEWKITDNDKEEIKVGLNVHSKTEDNDDNSLKGKIAGHIKVYKVSDNVKIPFGLYLDVDATFQHNLDIDANFTAKATILHKQDVLPDAASITIPIAGVPVKFKFCLGVDITLENTINATGNIKCRLPLHLEYNKDLADLFLGNFLSYLLRNHGASCSIDKDKGYVGLSASFGNKTRFSIAWSPGVGLYTEKLSTRILVVAPDIKFNFNTPGIHAGLGYGFDIRNHDGVEFKSSVGLGIQLWLPTDASSILNEIIDKIADWQKIIGYAAAYVIAQKYEAETADDYIKSVDKLNDWITKLKSPEKDGYFVFSTDTVKNLFPLNWKKTWAPTMEEQKNPFKFRKEYEKPPIRNEDFLHVEYTIDSIGILPIVEPFKPCLMITDKYYNFQKLVFNKNTINKNTKLPKAGLKLEYDIAMSDLSPEADLYALPGFYTGDKEENSFKDGIPTSSRFAFYFDKQQLVNTKTPPNTRIKWIYNYENEDLSSTPGRYKKQRMFRVKWVVDDVISGRATTTGIKFDKGVGDNGDLSQNVYIQQSEYMLEVPKMCEFNNDFKFFAYPYASRTDGSESGEIRVGTGTFIGDIPDGWSVIFQNGEKIEIQGPPPDGL